jgi:hypothetical protein
MARDPTEADAVALPGTKLAFLLLHFVGQEFPGQLADWNFR